MAGVVTAPETRDNVVIARAIVDDAAFAFVAPLHPTDNIRVTRHGRTVSRDTLHVILSRARSVRVEGPSRTTRGLLFRAELHIRCVAHRDFRDALEARHDVFREQRIRPAEIDARITLR